MHFDFERMSPAEWFEVMTGTVVPRLIALVTSLDADRRLNAAPYSFFAAIAVDPPLLAIGVLPHAEGRLKDTGLNDIGPFEAAAGTEYHMANGSRGRCCATGRCPVVEERRTRAPPRGKDGDDA